MHLASSLSIIPQTTTTMTTNKTQNSTDASPEIPIDYAEITTTQLLIFIASGTGGVFMLCVCLVVMIVCLEFKDEKGLQGYLERFLFLEDEFQADSYSRQNSPVNESLFTIVIPGSSGLSVNSMCRTPSVSIV